MSIIISPILKRKSFREVVLTYFIVIITFVLIIPSFFQSDFSNLGLGFFVTNLLIGAISFLMIITEVRKGPYSLHLIHWLFQYTFFFIAPLVQYLHGRFPWGLMFSVNDYNLLVITNFVILLWQVCWILPSKLFKFRLLTKLESFEPVSFHTTQKKIFILFLLSFVVLAYSLHIYGIGGLFTRGSEAVNSIENSSLQLLFSITGRAVPVVLLVVLGIQKHQSKFQIVLALILVLLTNFPAATPRFWAAAVFLGLMIIFFKINSKNILIYIVFLGLNIIFPILATVRNASNPKEFIELLNLNQTLSTNLITADYDAFSMIGYTWRYIELFGITEGNQLLTVFLFFIPRSLWVDKSVGSGYLVAENLGFVFNNVSSPLLAEGLINFGIPGVILFAFFFSTICLHLDRLYWQLNNPFIKIVYPFWIGFFFFIMRGDMLSSCAFTFGFTFCFIIFRPKIIKEH